MILTINKKDYHIEYSIEASLYADCTEKLLNLMLTASENDGRKMITATAEVPSVALTMFYAGLLEHHGLYGDGSIKGMHDAKNLLKQYFAENPKESYYTVLMKAIDQMGEDGFFQMIGLDKMIEESQKAQTETPDKAKSAAPGRK